MINLALRTTSRWEESTSISHMGLLEHAVTGTTVLLYHPTLELHRLKEALLQLRLSVVRARVGKTDGHVLDIGQCVLGTHVGHHIRGWPYWDALFLDATHGVIELVLISAVVLDLCP